MAKQKQSISLDQITQKLGYTLDYYNHTVVEETTFYSDFTPVPKNSYHIALRELEDFNKKYQLQAKDVSQGMPDIYNDDDDDGGDDDAKTIALRKDTITLDRTSDVGIYNSLLCIHHASGFRMSLRLARNEAARVRTAAKLTSYAKVDLNSIFFKLPRELRTRIYEFSIPDREWKVGDNDFFNAMAFSGSIGDPTGFYFPFGEEQLSLLRVSKQMRQEALPIAYRRTFFRLDGIDEFIKVALAIGGIGRANIEAVEFAWESRSDFQHQVYDDDGGDFDDLRIRLPTLHVQRCIQLLKECRRLKHLRLYFDEDIVSDTAFADLKDELGIKQLASCGWIKELDIQSLECTSLDQYEFVKWLKRKMESGDRQASGDENNNSLYA